MPEYNRKQKNERTVVEIESAELFPARFYSAPVAPDRAKWHRNAVAATASADIVFLDPDNGLETAAMRKRNSATEKHVKWSELADYYNRGQRVILYQHRPQMMKKEQCIQGILDFQMQFLRSDSLHLLSYPKYTNRFYFLFLHHQHIAAASEACAAICEHWKGFCEEVPLNTAR